MTLSDVVTFIIVVLAAHRITVVITSDRITSSVVWAWQNFWERRFIKKHARNDLEVLAYQNSEEWNSNLAYLVTCPWCVGFWVSGALMLASSPYIEYPLPLLFWLAMSSMVGLIAQTHHKT